MNKHLTSYYWKPSSSPAFSQYRGVCIFPIINAMHKLPPPSFDVWHVSRRKRFLPDAKSLMGQSFHMQFLGNPGRGCLESSLVLRLRLVAFGGSFCFNPIFVGLQDQWFFRWEFFHMPFWRQQDDGRFSHCCFGKEVRWEVAHLFRIFKAAKRESIYELLQGNQPMAGGLKS